MSDAPKKPRRPVEEVRAELMKSEETQQLAKTLGLKLEDYVEKVLSYYKDPNKQPMMYVLSEEQIRAAGVEPPTEKAIMEWLQKVDSGEIDLRPDHMKDGFKKPEKAPVSGVADEASVHEPAAPAADPEMGSALKEQLKQQIKRGGGKI